MVTFFPLLTINIAWLVTCSYNCVRVGEGKGHLEGMKELEVILGSKICLAKVFHEMKSSQVKQ